MTKMIVLACCVAGAYLFPASPQEDKAPPDVKVDIKKAIETAEKEFKGAEKLFISKVELVSEKIRSNENAAIRWTWVVEVQTFHASHWGPAKCTIDAMTGKIDEKGTYDHK